MTPSLDQVRDEARRRIALALGARFGADITQKVVLVMVEHLLRPSETTTQTLAAVLQLKSACQILERTRPVDYTSDGHWPVHAVQMALAEPETPKLLPAVDPLEAERSAALDALKGIREGITDALVAAARTAASNPGPTPTEVTSDPEAARRIVAIDDTLDKARTHLINASDIAEVRLIVRAARETVQRIVA